MLSRGTGHSSLLTYLLTYLLGAAMMDRRTGTDCIECGAYSASQHAVAKIKHQIDCDVDIDVGGRHTRCRRVRHRHPGIAPPHLGHPP